jgi:ferredoxin
LIMEIYYFSGTGNSLQVSRELIKRFPEATLIPIISALKNEKIEPKVETIGIVFPIHALTFPWPVKEFLQKIDLKSTSYIFAIATRVCFIKVFSDMNKILEKQNRSIDAYFSFEMPESYIPIFKCYSNEKILKVESERQKIMDSIENVIEKKDKHQPKDHKGWFILSHIIYPLTTLFFQKLRFPSMERSFYADSKCNGCGICEKVCLSGRIKMVNKRPQWQADIKCTYCFACLHFCPVHSIQIKNRNTIKKGRYHNPSITANDIIKQKSNDNI